MVTATNNNGVWVFVAASALVGFLGSRANQAITWWPFITSERNAASNCRGVLISVTPRNEFMPLLHIAFDVDGVPATYNPTGLKISNISLLVPPDVADQVNRQAERAAIEESTSRALAEIKIAKWEAERPAREAAERKRLENIAAEFEANRVAQILKDEARRNILAPVQALIPDGHFKFPHLWPVKFPQAGRLNYRLFGLPGSVFLWW
jgi:hypothetical protein